MFPINLVASLASEYTLYTIVVQLYWWSCIGRTLEVQALQ